jgi:hypothetical protein
VWECGLDSTGLGYRPADESCTHGYKFFCLYKNLTLSGWDFVNMVIDLRFSLEKKMACLVTVHFPSKSARVVI